MEGWFNYQYLLEPHLDVLMMTGLLFVFFLLFRHLRLTPPGLRQQPARSRVSPLGFSDAVRPRPPAPRGRRFHG
jgi:hypothetical protein